MGDKGKKGITPRRQTGTYFDMASNDMRTGPMVLMARVKPAGEVPKGVELLATRRDGRQVIAQWVGDPTATQRADLQTTAPQA